MNSQYHHGQNLETLFLKFGKTKEEAAALMGYAPAYLSRYYKQEDIPRKILIAAASTFGVEVADFDLSPDQFEAKLTALLSAPSPADVKAQEVERLRAEVKEKIEIINQWTMRYLSLLEEYNKHLKQSKGE